MLGIPPPTVGQFALSVPRFSWSAGVYLGHTIMERYASYVS